MELGYRGSGEVLKREEFEAKKKAAEASRLSRKTQKKVGGASGLTAVTHIIDYRYIVTSIITMATITTTTTQGCI